MLGTFETHSILYLYDLPKEAAKTIKRAEGENPQLGLDFHDNMVNLKEVESMPQWCDFSTTVEIAVFSKYSCNSKTFDRIAAVIDDYVEFCRTSLE